PDRRPAAPRIRSRRQRSRRRSRFAPLGHPSRLPSGPAGHVVAADELAVHRKMQSRTVPVDQAPGARTVLDGAMTPRRVRPPRFDAWVALAGLTGGLLLWGFGLGVRQADDPLVLFDGRRPLLLPLAVIVGCELLRRTTPRTALAVGTLALAADTLTRGSIATIVMYTDLMYAAVLYGTPATARRLPWITGMLTIAATLVPFAVWRVPEALLIGLVVGAVTFTPASTGLIVRNHRDAADSARLRAEQTALLAEMDRTQAVNQERARMARELHDVVANHLSAIAIHSTAALSLD